LPTLTTGELAVDQNGKVYKTATTTAGTGLSFDGTSFTVNSSQSIATLSNLTTNGVVYTSGGAGTLNTLSTFFFNGATQSLGVGTSTPKWSLTAASSTGPQLALTDASNTQAPWTFRSLNGALYIGTTTPGSFATSTAPLTWFRIEGDTATSTFAYGVQANKFAWVATSTGQNGLDLDAGCFSIKGTCLSTGGSVSGGAANKVAFWTGATTLSNNSLFHWDDSNVRLGIGTSSPNSALSVMGANAWFDTPLFTFGTTTASKLQIDYRASATSTIPNNVAYAWTIATSTTGLPLFRIDSTTNGEQVTVGARGSDVYIGDVGYPSNLIFEENSTIYGHNGKTLTFGQGNDIINFAVKTGVGTSSPWAKLAVQGTLLQTNPILEVASSSNAIKFLSVAGDGFGTTTLSGLTISGSATSTSNVGYNITSGCYAINNTCVGAQTMGTTSVTVDGNYTKPSDNLLLIVVEAWGGGGGGAGGSGGSSGTVRSGGGGGGGGGYFSHTFNASAVPSTVVVDIGAGGTTAASATDGNAGAVTSFGSLLSAYGGGAGGNSASSGGGGGGGGSAGGVGGNSTNQTGAAGGGGGGAANTDGGMGGAGGSTAANSPPAGHQASWGGGGGGASSANGSAQAGSGGSSLHGAGGGGAGGDCGTTCTERQGGAGGVSPSTSAGGGGTAGATNGGGGGTGPTDTKWGGGGGGGGGSQDSGTGGLGGDGGVPGGGGGGGGIGETTTGGAGGNGGRGEVHVWEIYGTGADLAEIYGTTDPTLEAGDLVMLDPALKAGVKKSDGAYAHNLMGIISTNPGLTMGDLEDQGAAPVAVALTGRVPTKVSAEAGPIYIGDLLTSSSEPGVATKATVAGEVIGFALANYAPGDASAVGVINVFLKPGRFDGVTPFSLLKDEASTTPATDLGREVLGYLMNHKDDPRAPAHMSEINTDRLVAGLEVVTPRVVTGTLVTNAIEPVTSGITMRLIAGGRFLIEKIDGPVLSVSVGTSTATAGAALLSIDDLGNAIFAGALTGASLEIGSHDKPAGITLYDTATGEPHCSQVTNGALVTVAGKCGVPAATAPPSSPPPDTPPPSGPPPASEAPVITINGNNPATVQVGDAYADLGASVTDDKDQNLGIHIFVGDTEVPTVSLDTSTTTMYSIIYRATDSDDNTGEAIRTVNVVAPEVVLDSPPGGAEASSTPQAP
jgi:hypothetical protein